MTLTELSYYFRRFLPYLVLSFLVFLIIVYGVRLAMILIRAKRTPTLQVNTIFDKIKRPSIPNSVSSNDIVYSLDTVEGQPVTATSAAKILFLTPPRASIAYREKIYLIAKTIGFDTEAVRHRLTGNDAVFEDSNQKLDVDISNFNFTYQYFFENNPSIFDNASSPLKDESENEAVNFLQSIGKYPDEFAQGKTNVTFMRYNVQDKTITNLPNNVNSNLVEVDYYRPDIDAFPIVSSKYFTSQNYVLLVFSDGGPKILRSQIRYFEKAPDQIGIYPVKTGEQAYEDLKKGRGYIVSNPENLSNVTLKKMFLGYYDPEIYQDYLQPVYVFLGDNKFVAYVPAVINEYLTD